MIEENRRDFGILGCVDRPGTPTFDAGEKVAGFRSTVSELAMNAMNRSSECVTLDTLIEKKDISIHEAENMILASLPCFEFEEGVTKLKGLYENEFPAMILAMRREYIENTLGEGEVTVYAKKLLHNCNKNDNFKQILRASKKIGSELIVRFNQIQGLSEINFGKIN